jgi:hypothetical protein
MRGDPTTSRIILWLLTLQGHGSLAELFRALGAASDPCVTTGTARRGRLATSSCAMLAVAGRRTSCTERRELSLQRPTPDSHSCWLCNDWASELHGVTPSSPSLMSWPPAFYT